ncbi:MAG: hypothetical protein AB1508_19200 [Pseudomonadota bacterium]
MAGDWIPMRVDLADDPAVIKMAEMCAIPRAHVVGCLHAVWSWFDQQTVNGEAPTATLELLDILTGISGFGKIMSAPEVGWMTVTKRGGLKIPHVERYMSQTAKRRLLTARRNKRYRDARVTQP